MDVDGPAAPDGGDIPSQRHHEPAVLAPDLGAIHGAFLPVGAATQTSLSSYPFRRPLYRARVNGLRVREDMAGLSGPGGHAQPAPVHCRASHPRRETAALAIREEDRCRGSRPGDRPDEALRTAGVPVAQAPPGGAV